MKNVNQFLSFCDIYSGPKIGHENNQYSNFLMFIVKVLSNRVHFLSVYFAFFVLFLGFFLFCFVFLFLRERADNN